MIKKIKGFKNFHNKFSTKKLRRNDREYARAMKSLADNIHIAMQEANDFIEKNDLIMFDDSLDYISQDVLRRINKEAAAIKKKYYLKNKPLYEIGLEAIDNYEDWCDLLAKKPEA